ncbi:hypothetical protein I8B09_002465 [Vibrio vulnificus]|nr:hypothetical protein [Vibrio vulnificus]EJY4611841.1 hypothetical protein [Vibrio vulnificus]
MMSNKFTCVSKRDKTQRDACLNKIEENEVDIYVLESKALVDLWLFEKKFKGLNEHQIKEIAASMGVAEFISSRGALMHDLKSFFLIAEDLHKGGGIQGKYEIIKNGANSYITFKGNHRLRSIIKGTRYLSNNTKIIALGIGQSGLKVSTKGGVYLTFIYSVPFRTLELAFKNNYLLSNWVINVTSDVLKASISAIFGYFAGSFFISTSGIVLLPILVGVIVAFGVGEGLTYFEGKLELKQKLVAAIDRYVEKEAKNTLEKLDSEIRSLTALGQIRLGSYGVGFR